MTFPSHIEPGHIVRAWQVQGLAVLATVYFSVVPPCAGYITAFLLNHISGVKPALQMSAAELAFGVLLVTGALSQLFEFDFMIRKLLGFGCCCSGGQEFLSRPKAVSTHILPEPPSCPLRRRVSIMQALGAIAGLT
jgi:hypothetical protein